MRRQILSTIVQTQGLGPLLPFSSLLLPSHIFTTHSHCTFYIFLPKPPLNIYSFFFSTIVIYHLFLLYIINNPDYVKIYPLRCVAFLYANAFGTSPTWTRAGQNYGICCSRFNPTLFIIIISSHTPCKLLFLNNFKTNTTGVVSLSFLLLSFFSLGRQIHLLLSTGTN